MERKKKYDWLGEILESIGLAVRGIGEVMFRGASGFVRLALLTEKARRRNADMQFGLFLELGDVNRGLFLVKTSDDELNDLAKETSKEITLAINRAIETTEELMEESKYLRKKKKKEAIAL